MSAPRDVSQRWPRLLPPVWTALFGIGMWALARLGIADAMLEPLPEWIVWALLAMSLLLMGATAETYRRHRTTIIPGRTPSALITDGPFRVSRNPIYLADVLLLVGWALALDSAALLAGPLALVATLRRLFIVREERLLTELFGAEYDAYRARVRRWL